MRVITEAHNNMPMALENEQRRASCTLTWKFSHPFSKSKLSCWTKSNFARKKMLFKEDKVCL